MTGNWLKTLNVSRNYGTELSEYKRDNVVS